MCLCVYVYAVCISLCYNVTRGHPHRRSFKQSLYYNKHIFSFKIPLFFNEQITGKENNSNHLNLDSLSMTTRVRLARQSCIWRRQASLALCAGNSPVTGEFPAQRPVTRSFDVFFDLRLHECLSKQPRRWWFETPSCSLWRHCNVAHTRRRHWHDWMCSFYS